jgi:hypothetical protein
MGASRNGQEKIMSKIDQVVYLIEDGKIIESSIRDLSGYIDETTTPRGVGPRYHTRGNELWTWGHQGNNPRIVSAYDTEAEAEEALEDTFAHDFWNCADILAFTTREDAEKWLAENAE